MGNGKRLLALAVCLVCMLSASALSQAGNADTRQERYEYGEMLLALRQYEDALEEFLGIIGYKDSEHYTIYIDAILAIEANALTKAEINLVALASEEFLDSAALLQYVKARRFEEAGEIFDAIDHYMGLQVLDSLSRRLELIYESTRIPEVLQASRAGNSVYVLISAKEGAQSQRLYRAYGEYGEFERIAELKNGQTNYTDVVSPNERVIRYRASAVYGGSETALSVALTIAEQGAEAGANISGFRADTQYPAKAILSWTDAQTGNQYAVEYYPEGMKAHSKTAYTSSQELALDGLIPDTRYTATLRVPGDDKHVNSIEFFARSDTAPNERYSMLGANLFGYNVETAESYERMGMDGVAAMMELDKVDRITDGRILTPQYRIGEDDTGYIAAISILNAERATLSCTCAIRLNDAVYARSREFTAKKDALVATLFVPLTDMLNEYYEDCSNAWRQTEAQIDFYIGNVLVYAFSAQIEQKRE